MPNYFVLLSLLCCVFGDDVVTVTVTVKEGESVTLNTGVTKQQHNKIQWYFNNTHIALINGHPNMSCLYDGEDGRFRDRLKVDYESGSLTITDIRSEHAGRYEAERIRSESSGKRQSLNRNQKCDSTKISRKSTHDDTIKIFSVIVSGVFGDDVVTVTVKEGESVTLNTGVTKQQHNKIQWYFNNTHIALINGHPNMSCLYDGEDGRFRDRLKVDYESGSLTITDIRSEHAGRYEAERIRSESSGKRQSLNRNQKCDSTKISRKSTHDDTIKIFSVIVSGSGLSAGVKAGIAVSVVLLVFVSAAAGVIYYRHRRSKNADKKKNNQEVL